MASDWLIVNDLCERRGGFICAELQIKCSKLKREPGSLCCVLDIIITNFHKRIQCSQNASLLSGIGASLCSIIVKDLQFDK